MKPYYFKCNIITFISTQNSSKPIYQNRNLIKPEGSNKMKHPTIFCSVLQAKNVAIN